MKRLFALIGFTYLVTLTAVIFVPENTVKFAFIVLVILFIGSLFIKSFREEKSIPIAILTAVAASGIFLLNYNFKIAPVQTLAERDMVITGRICELPNKKYDGYYYVVEVKKIFEEENIKDFKIRLSSSNALEADVYDEFTCKIHTFLPVDSRSFSSKRFYMSKGIYLFGYVYDYEGISIEPSLGLMPPYYYALKVRERLLSSIRTLLPENQASIASGVLLGEKNNIPDDIKNDFCITGVYHLLVVSGVHVWIISDFIIMMFKSFKLSKRLASMFTSVLVFCFIAVTGFTPSAMRAGFMVITCMMGSVFYRKYDPLNALGLSVFLICLFNPCSGSAIGLWLSFLSAFGIIISSRRIKEWIRVKFKVEKNCGKIKEYIIGTAASSIAVTVFTLPVFIVFFKRVSLISIISNIFMLFPISTMLICTLAAGVFYIIIPSAAFIYLPCTLVSGTIANYLIFCARTLGKIPFAYTSTSFPFVRVWVAFSLILIALAMIFGDLKKLTKITILLSLNLLFAGILSYQACMKDVTRVSVLDVGNGCSVVLSKNGRASVISCGGEEKYLRSIPNALENINIRKLDCLLAPSEGAEARCFLESAAGYYSPEVIVLPKSDGKSLNLLRKYNTARFEDGVHCKIWGNVDVSVLKNESKGFVLLKVSDIKFLLCPCGGNALDIPKSWRNCDFFIAGAVPENYKYIKPLRTFLSMNEESCKWNFKKLYDENMNPVVISGLEAMHIDVGKSGDIAVRGEI